MCTLKATENCVYFLLAGERCINAMMNLVYILRAGELCVHSTRWCTRRRMPLWLCLCVDGSLDEVMDPGVRDTSWMPGSYTLCIHAVAIFVRLRIRAQPAVCSVDGIPRAPACPDARSRAQWTWLCAGGRGLPGCMGAHVA
jgi:hypothetical protein